MEELVVYDLQGGGEWVCDRCMLGASYGCGIEPGKVKTMAHTQT